MNTKPTSILRDCLRHRPLNIVWMLFLLVYTSSWGQQITKEEGGKIKEEEVIKLDPFSVTAKSDASGYGVTSSSSATRLNTPLRDIPQTINIVTEKLIEELAVENIGSAVSLTPGVTIRAGTPDTFAVRSYDVFSQFRNGFRYSRGSSLNFNRDLSNVARVEIIKGLGSATTGQGEAGGVIDIITKKPQPKKAQSVKLTVGSWGYYNTELDSTGPLNNSGAVLYRMIASYTGGSTYMPNEEYDRLALYPSVEFHLGQNTTLLFEGGLHSGRTPTSNFFDIPDERQFFLRDSNGNPLRMGLQDGALHRTIYLDQKKQQTLDFVDPNAELYELLASLTHKFNDWLSTRQAVGAFKAGVDYEMTRMLGFGGYVFDPQKPKGLPIDWLTSVRNQTEETDTEFASLQGDILLDYVIGKTTNQTLIGYEFTRRDTYQRRGLGVAPAIYRALDDSAFLNLKRSDLPPLRITANTQRNSTESGLYLQHSTKLWDDRLQILGGWRYDDQKEDINDLLRNSKSVADPAHTDATYRFGASFRISPWLTVFAVRAQQLDPARTEFRYPRGNEGVLSRDPTELITAARGVVLNEVGIKSELLDGRLTLNATYYDLAESDSLRINIFRTNPNDDLNPLFNWTEYVRDPGSTSSGLEIEAWGSPNDWLSFYASAALMDTGLDVLQPDGSIIVRKRRGHTDTRLAFVSNFRLHKGNGWALYGLNALSYTDDVVLNPDNQNMLEGSLRVDLGLKLLMPKQGWEAQARVENILNERINTGTGGSGTGPRRLTFYLKRIF